MQSNLDYSCPNSSVDTVEIQLDLPEAKICEPGTTCSFRVRARGNGKLSFSWKKRKVNRKVENLREKSNKLTLTANTKSKAHYFCEILDQSGNKVTTTHCLLKVQKSSYLLYFKVTELLQKWHLTLVEMDNVQEVVRELKPFLLSIIKTPSSTIPVKDEQNRHIKWLKSTKRERSRQQEIKILGMDYFTTETIENLNEALIENLNPERQKTLGCH